MSGVPALKIMGQELSYPETWQGTIAVSIFSIALCISLAIIYIWADKDSFQHVENLFYSFHSQRYNADGTLASSELSHQIQFWTPSLNTYRDKNINEIEMENRWQKLTDNTKIIEFEKLLNQYAKGWRRMEVYGSGRTRCKYGYWWILTMKEDFKMQSFIALYSKFWGNTKTVYVEEEYLHSDYQDKRYYK